MNNLDFEKPLSELQEKIDQLKKLSSEKDLNLSDEITRIEKRAQKVKEEIYSHLTPSQILQIARHSNRPDTLGLTSLLFKDFVELHGDRQFRDDPSIVGGPALFKKTRIMAIGHQKGNDTKSNIYRNFGMAHPEGYRKALRLMKMAEKFDMPIITFINTPGAYPGIEAEERGQAEAIARNLKEMSSLKVPIISFIIGEGGSGGALGIGVSNRVYMLQYALYSVISPEGCASILFRDPKKAGAASDMLKITAEDIVKLDIANDWIPEPVGGAHNNWPELAESLKKRLTKDLSFYKTLTPEAIAEERYTKFRQMGKFSNNSSHM